MIESPLSFVPMVIIGIAFGIAVLLSSIAYIVGVALGDERIKGWARFEVYEVFYSAILGILIAGSWSIMISISDGIAKSIDPFGYVVALGSSDNKPLFFTVAQNYMREIYGEVLYLYVEISKVTSITLFLGSISYGLGGPMVEQVGGTIEFSHCPLFVGPFNFLMGNVTEMLIRVGLITIVQAAVLGFIKHVMPFFIGVGFGLRILGPTRKLGGLMMAIGLTFYFVLPMFYVFGSGVYHSLKEDEHFSGMRISKFNSYFGTLSIFGNSIDYDNEFDERLALYKEYIESGKLEEMETQEAEESIKQNLNEINEAFSAQDISIFSILLLIGDYIAQVAELLGNILCISRVAVQAWSYGVLSPVVVALAPNSLISEVMFEILANLLFFISVFSFMGLMAMIAGVKGLSPLLGGDVEIAGLTHFI